MRTLYRARGLQPNQTPVLPERQSLELLPPFFRLGLTLKSHPVFLIAQYNAVASESEHYASDVCG